MLTEIPNPDYPSPAVKAVYEFLWDSFLPLCLSGQTNSAMDSKKKVSPMICLPGPRLLTLISTAAGLAIFQRKDVK